jgi:para-aminobenzoate synthetase component 1
VPVTGPLVPVLPAPRAVVEPYGRWVDPLAALRACRGLPHAALLLSALDTHPAGRHSILAFEPLLTASLRGRELELRRFDAGASGGDPGSPAVERRAVRDPFEALRMLAPAGAVRPAVEGLPFAGGVIGYLGYGLRRAVESIPEAPPDPLGQPDAWLGLYDGAALFDHRERRVFALATGMGARDETERAARAATRLGRIRGHLDAAAAGGGAAAPGGSPAAARPRALVIPEADYLRRVRRVLDDIAAGDVYQVNLSHRVECPDPGDPVELFVRLSRRNPAPFAAYLDCGRFQVACASPERFVALHGDRAWSSPIKGTRPRGGDPARDAALARALAASAKDRAENVMIADLVRNDLGRVCASGSVRVDALCAVESFATVHHLVSTVSGRLRSGADRVDLLRALFPGGSMTGAPKVRAMEIIDELEGEERGIYAGAIGHLSADGRMDFNIVIRTILVQDGRASFRVGGGIVADSDPRAEYRETLDKAAALLDALGADAAEGGGLRTAD